MDATVTAPAELDPKRFFEAGKAGANAIFDLQKEFLSVYEDAGETWLKRLKSECNLWAEFATQLSEARTLPDGLRACQHSFSKRVRLATEDGQFLIGEGQRIANAVRHTLSSP
jgi:hypothetical protein